MINIHLLRLRILSMDVKPRIFGLLSLLFGRGSSLELQLPMSHLHGWALLISLALNSLSSCCLLSLSPLLLFALGGTLDWKYLIVKEGHLNMVRNTSIASWRWRS